MREKTDWMLLIGLVVAGGALGGLVAFDRSIDDYSSAVMSGIWLGVGLSIAIYAMLAHLGGRRSAPGADGERRGDPSVTDAGRPDEPPVRF